jgi:hypothetical protein
MGMAGRASLRWRGSGPTCREPGSRAAMRGATYIGLLVSWFSGSALLRFLAGSMNCNASIQAKFGAGRLRDSTVKFPKVGTLVLFGDALDS